MTIGGQCGRYVSRQFEFLEVGIMAKRPSRGFNEKKLTKGQLRKLNALRKSLGNDIANRAFSEWLETSSVERGAAEDKGAAAIAEACIPSGLVGQIC